jgi:hypothetical protein
MMKFSGGRLIEITLFISQAYTGYRRSIDGVLEAGSVKSNSNEPHSSDVDVDNHTLKSTATIITQNTSSSSSSSPQPTTAVNSSESFIKNEQQAQGPPPQPAPRTSRLSSQNSIPMTNGDGAKADDAAQVRFWLCSRFVLALGFRL